MEETLMMLLLWSKLKGYVIAAGALAALVLSIYMKGRSDQKTSAVAKESQDRLKDIKKAKEIENEVRKMPESSIDRELDRWMRD